VIRYEERLAPSIFTWVLYIGFTVAGSLLIATRGEALVVQVVITAALVAFAAVLLTLGGQFRVVVDDEALRVGRRAEDAVGLEHITELRTLTPNGIERYIGLFSSPFKASRASPMWIRHAVLVGHDGTVPRRRRQPYWVVGSRHPERLAEVLRAGVERARG
jgi:hypothetical protein